MAEVELDASGLKPVFHELIESRLESLSPAIDRIMDAISALPCARANLDKVRLALTEALSNAIIHGNRGDPSKRVEIHGACAHEEQLVLSITDEGEGFNPAAIPDPTVAENIFSSHGRGIYLMHRLMDHAEHRLGGRQVILRKRLKPKSRG